MRVDGNLGGNACFYPNSAGLWDNQPELAEPRCQLKARRRTITTTRRRRPLGTAGLSVSPDGPRPAAGFVRNTAKAMGDACLHIKERQIANCLHADPAYGGGVALALGVNIREAAK
jgi:catalase